MQVPFVSRWHSSGLILAIVLLLLIAPVSQGLTPTYTAADPPVSNSSEPRSEPPTIESNGPYSTGSNADRLSPSATARTIILITGSTITVQKHNNTLNYQVHEGSPVTHIKQGSKNYLIPRGTNLSRYDRSLFHVERLLATQSANQELPVFLQTNDPTTVLTKLNDTTSQYLPSAGVIATTIDPTNPPAITDTDAITRISIDRTVTTTSPTNNLTPSRLPDLTRLTGDGVTIAVLDTGIDESHPAIEPNLAGSISFTDSQPPTNKTIDTHGHGTAVAGIAAGAKTTTGRSTRAGIAPNASIYDIQVMNQHGTGSASTVIRGIEYAVKHTNADIILLSVSFSIDNNEPLAEAVEWATTQGVIVVSAAGNTGTPRSINAAGYPPATITVGATTHNGTPSKYSSRGPTRTGSFKPELVAPGHTITGPRSSVSTRFAIDPAEYYTQISGTSAAAPQTAGAIALLLEQNPGATRHELENRLASTATPTRNAHAYAQGAGELNINHALDPTILVDPANIDLGLIENNTTITRTVTITNHDNQSHTLFFRPDIQNVDTNTPAPGTITLNRSTVTLAPNEQTSLNITINAITEPGAYSGIIHYKVNGKARSITIGFMRGATITVEKHPFHPNGSVDGDDLWILTEEGTHDQLLQFTNNTAQFTAGGGTYILWSTGTDETTGTTIFHSERHTFQQPTRLILDERNTIPVGFPDTHIDPSHKPLHNLSLSVSMSTDYAAGTARIAVSKQRTKSRNIRISPDQQSNVAITYLLASTTNQQTPLDASDLYHIAYGMQGITPTSASFPTNPFTTTTHHYYRRTVDETFSVHDKATVNNVWQSHPIRWFALGDRVIQRVHRLEHTATYSRSYDGGTWRATTPSTKPSGTPTRVLSHPLFAKILPLNFTNNTTTVTGIPFSDQPGTRFDPGTTPTLTVENETQSTATHSLTNGALTAPSLSVSPNESLHITLTGNNSHGYLSTKTRTEVTLHHYSPTADTTPIVSNQPPIITNINISAVSPTNAIPPGQHHVTIDVKRISTIQNPIFWYTTTSASDPPWENPTGWTRTTLETFNNKLRADITIPEDASTLSIATHLQTPEKHTTRTMTTDAVHIGTAPNSSTAILRGQILTTTGEPLTNDTIIIDPTPTGTPVHAPTNSTGWFEHELPKDRTYNLLYFRGEPWHPREPTNNLPAWRHLTETTLTDDTTLTPTTIPPANHLTLEVIDERGQPVPNAPITITTTNTSHPITETLTTTQHGLATRHTQDTPGIYLTGSLQLTIDPPDSPLYLPTPYQTNLTLNESQHVTVQLQTTPPTASLFAYSTFEFGDPVFLDATQSTIPAGVKEYRWDLNNSGTPNIITTDPVISFRPHAPSIRPTLTIVDTANKTDTATVTITYDF